MFDTYRRLAMPGLLALAAALAAAPGIASNGSGFVGLLRSRDLTPFGFLRLDMRPAHAVASEPGDWAIETELGYQNTWALSPAVEKYLDGQPRHELGPADLAAIQALPGENYLVDLELAQLDLTFHYKFRPHWDAYLVSSATHYGGGFLDSTIEGFHQTFGFSTFGRKGANRNQANVIFDLKSSQTTFFGAPTRGGLLDPTLGLRYTALTQPRNWNLVLEAAAKVPVFGRRDFLSTGRMDSGVQVSFQRFWSRHAVFISGSAVYFAGERDIVPTRAQVVPTLIAGYERWITARTHVILQGYISSSVYSHRETDLNELRGKKYQVSAGLYHLRGRNLFSFGVTENLQNVDNTPDVGFQLGWVYGPALSRTAL